MTAKFDWVISALDCVISDDGKHDVVKTVHWRCEGIEIGANTTFFGSTYGTCTLPAPDREFTTYGSLKKEQVLGWVWDQCVDKDATEAVVQAQIDQAKTPAVVQPALPWVTE